MSDPKFAWQLYDVPLLAWPSSVLAKRNHPPDDAAVNDCYIVASNPSGEWVDHVNHIAVRSAENAWVYQVPPRGRRVYVHSLRVYQQFNGREWTADEVANSLPPGGLTGYVLSKATDEDFDAEWIAGNLIQGVGGGGGAPPVKLFATDETVAGVDPEGTLGLVLGNGFGAYRERGGVWERVGSVGWTYRGHISQVGIPEGGTTGQVLAKTSNTSFIADWVTPEDGGLSTITEIVAGTGLTGGGTTGIVTIDADFGSSAGTICQGNDARLTNDRTADGLRTTTGVVTISGAIPPVTGQYLRATSPTSASWQTLSGGSGGGSVLLTGNPYIDEPPSPDSWNDEFLDGSPDLATRGWTVRNHDDATYMIRVGDITGLPSAALGSNEYRSTLVGSTLFMQIPGPGKRIAVVKPCTGSYMFMVRMGVPMGGGAWGGLFLTTNAEPPFFTQYHSEGTGPGWTLVYIDGPPSMRYLARTIDATSHIDVNITTNVNFSFTLDTFICNHDETAPSQYGTFVNAGSMQSRGTSMGYTGGSNIMTTPVAMAGFALNIGSGMGVGGGVDIFTIDYARRMPVNSWLGY